MRSEAPVFVVGCPRSGTTWLYHLLLSSGGFAIYRIEVKAFTYLAPLAAGFRHREKRERFLKTWLCSEDFLRSGLDAQEFQRQILEECQSTGDFQRILMEGICEQQHARRWSDCTPDNLLHMLEIKESFPDALFIHIIRDGRDVALSLAAQDWVSPLPWEDSSSRLAAAAYWNWIVDKGRKLGRQLGRDYMELHYRDLVRDPAETLSVIADFACHDLDYERIQSNGIGSERKPNSSFSDATSNAFNPVDRWKTALSSAELRVLEALLGRQLEDLNYALMHRRDDLRWQAVSTFNWFLYHCSFSTRSWLKHHTPLGERLGDVSLLTDGPHGEKGDRTLRPGHNREYIRSLVAQEACSDRH